MSTAEYVQDDTGATELAVPEAGSLEQVTRAQFDALAATAAKRPRNVKAFYQSAVSIATLTPEVAESCTYRLPPRDGKTIIGKSVRLAEIVANAWGRLWTEVRCVEVGHAHVTVSAKAIDMETLTGCQVEVRRPILTSKGKRYSESMISQTVNAATSIAYRNAIFRIVPAALVDPIWQAAQQVASGDQRSIESRRVAALDWFAKKGAHAKEVYTALGVTGIEDIDESKLEILSGMRSGIISGDLILEDALGINMDAEPPAEKPSRAQQIAERQQGKETKA